MTLYNNTSFIEIGEIRLKDKFYEEQLIEVLEKGGFRTSLITNGIDYKDIRLLTENPNATN